MTDTAQMPFAEKGHLKLIHVVVIVLSVILTYVAWSFANAQVDRQTQNAFSAARDQALGLIVDRMNKYEDALWAGVAAVESHGGDISYPAWQIFAQTLRIEERYPGINGIGVTHYLTAQSLDGYLAQQQALRPDYRVFPAHDQPIYMPITLIEPVADNAAAVGLDLAHERNRRTAALASRDTGEAQITDAITLVQDADKTAGFLFYAPVYRDGPPQDPANREARFLGTVYAPFVVHRLMEGLLAKDLRQVRFSIKDGDDVIYDEHGQDDPLNDPDPMFAETIDLTLYGRVWSVNIRTNLAFRQSQNLSKPTFILFAGLFIEALIISLLYQMSRANTQAVSYANRVTAELRDKSADLAATNTELTRKNDELERYSYVASHDLKTPLRGIGSLTEMIEEDLEEYLSSASANPDVAQNLTRIQERVDRMNDLTKGIMDYTQVGKDPTEQGAPVVLKQMIETMRMDFGLDSDQLKLIADVDVIEADTVRFRQVIENLVGNAIKYHDAVQLLEIKIDIKDAGDIHKVSVTDNGPGIDPQFHERVFEVFQTLRTPDAPESTGIGLSIVKKAVERHGGHVTLKSQLGHGAAFSFDWPKDSNKTDDKLS